MRMQWRGLELPAKVELDENVSNDLFGRFSAEPFERGFGTTIGNSLRRILLSSLEGAAVTQMRIKGADHEFTSLPGVLEDVTDIILNVKALVVSLEGDEPRDITVRRSTAGPVTAGDLDLHPDVDIIDEDHVIATLTEDVEFELTLTVGKGRGFRSAAENRETGDEVELGIIAVDSVFSPVTRVRYNTENARVGQKTDFDKLILEVWTDGTVSPGNGRRRSGENPPQAPQPVRELLRARRRDGDGAGGVGDDRHEPAEHRPGTRAEAQHDGAGA